MQEIAISKKKVLFIHQSSELYGSDRVLLNIVGGLVGGPYEIDVMIPEKGPLYDELKKLGVSIQTCDVVKARRGLKNYIRTLVSLVKRESINNSYDVVYSNTLAVLLGIKYKKSKKSVTHIWHVHEILTRPLVAVKVYSYLLHKYSDVIVYNSNQTKKYWELQNIKLQGKGIVVFNGIDTKRCSCGESRSSDDEIITIGIVGRISHAKGQKLLLDAFSRIIKKQDLPNINLVIVGDTLSGKEKLVQELESYIVEKGINDYVEIRPFEKDINIIWKGIDIAVVPSILPESFGLVAIEAMCHGIPVVAAEHGGIMDIVVDNVTGLFFRPGDVVDLTSKLEQLISDSSKRESFGREGCIRAHKYFRLETQIKQIGDIVRSS